MREHEVPCAVCAGTGSWTDDNGPCPDCRGSGRCGCGECTDIFVSALQGLVMHMYVHSGYRDNGYDKMSREQRDLYLRVTGRKRTCGECGQAVLWAGDEKSGAGG